MVESPKGTGKTRWLQENVANDPALFLTHRVALAKDVANRNKTAYYKDNLSSIQRRLTICVNSLMTLLDSNIHDGAYLVIDEATQLLRHFIGDTCKSNRQAIYWALARKVKQCKQLILLDADMNNETLEFFVGLMNYEESKITEDDITWVKNSWNPKDKVFKEYPCSNSLTLDLVNSVQKGLNCYVACDTKEQVDVIAEILKSCPTLLKSYI